MALGCMDHTGTCSSTAGRWMLSPTVLQLGKRHCQGSNPFLPLIFPLYLLSRSWAFEFTLNLLFFSQPWLLFYFLGNIPNFLVYINHSKCQRYLLSEVNPLAPSAPSHRCTSSSYLLRTVYSRRFSSFTVCAATEPLSTCLSR